MMPRRARWVRSAFRLMPSSSAARTWLELLRWKALVTTASQHARIEIRLVPTEVARDERPDFVLERRCRGRLAGARQPQVGRRDQRPSGQQHGVVHDVFQLADIAGPRVAGERGARLPSEHQLRRPILSR